MSRLVEALTLKIGRPVIDKTGFTELFDLDLHFAYDSSLGGMSGGRPSDSGDPSGEPNIFTALRQQLGLRLVPSKAQIDVIVIDHIEQPSAN